MILNIYKQHVLQEKKLFLLFEKEEENRKFSYLSLKFLA